MRQSEGSVEQVDLRRLVDFAYEEFNRTLLSAGSRYVLWGSFSSAQDLTKRYLQAKGLASIADGRRTESSRSAEDASRLLIVESSAEEAWQYVNWVRTQDGQPVLRETLVSYCSAFECCLKNVGLAFLLASKKQRRLDDRVFVPGDQFRLALTQIKEGWHLSGQQHDFRAKVFFDKFLGGMNPDPEQYDLSATAPENWEICQAAFDLRNAVVHQMGRPSQQITVLETTFRPLWPIELQPKHIRHIANALRSILFPLDPIALAI